MHYDPVFLRAVDFTLPREGGFVDDPNDNGGATKHGISLRFLRSLGELGDINNDGDSNVNDITAITPTRATALYYTHFWLRQGLSSLPTAVAICQFDASVNCGINRAVRLLQEALCDMGHHVTVDGIIGAKTRGAVVMACATPHGETMLAMRMTLQRISFYNFLAANKTRRTYLRGWIDRALSLASYATQNLQAVNCNL